MSSERLYAIQGRRDPESARLEHGIANMRKNKAYRYAVERVNGDPNEEILAQFISRFRAYRTGWRGNPKLAIERRLHDRYFGATGNPPLCVDIETAAVCDLACPFCYRQWIATPDKQMEEELYYRIIDQCAELGVPSVKLNWRGEPLLHPKLPEFIDYAKRKGILETIINTDATTLTERKSQELIEAGLDLLIFSFDGGTKGTYEKMRPGRFKENTFEAVYGNIKRFHSIRSELSAAFPRTKIQMVLTEDTYKEQGAFFELFSGCVDDVSVKAYTERGGEVQDLDVQGRAKIEHFLSEHSLPGSTPYWRDMHGNMFVSLGRLPCEQIYQRLMVTYDGTVSMCCYDWGSQYPIGYVDAKAFTEVARDYEAVMEKIQRGARGFELLVNAKLPDRFIDPPKTVQTLKEIWDGRLLNTVRQCHVEGRIEEVAICKPCQFKETYRWVKIPI